MRDLPASGCSSPVSMRNSVVLPAPFGPMMPTMPPRGTVEAQVLVQQALAEGLAQVSRLEHQVAEAGPGGM
jgi:hypothetical protein